MAARDLRNEILRFSLGDLYFSPVAENELVTMLMRWLKSSPNDGSRILVILDDLDGLSEFKDGPDPPTMIGYSKAFSGNSVDLIYTTRNPSMAYNGSVWEATLFDVPPLHVDDAVDLLGHTLKESYTKRDRFNTSCVQQLSSLEHDSESRAQMVELVTRLGTLPAAIVLGSHYIKDNLGSTWNPSSCKLFLDKWDQDSSKSHILKSHPVTFSYRHSMLASFDLSIRRLWDNVGFVPWNRGNPYKLLQLLSAMHLQEISPHEYSKLKNALRRASHDLKGDMKNFPLRGTGIRVGIRGTVIQRHEPTAERTDEVLPETHWTETSLNGFIRELVNVSLLTLRPTDGTLFLNNVTQACALLVPDNISSKEKLAQESNAKEIWRHWDPPRDFQA